MTSSLTLFCQLWHSAERQQGQRSSYSFSIELRVPIGTLTSTPYSNYIVRTKAPSPIAWSVPDAFNSINLTTPISPLTSIETLTRPTLKTLRLITLVIVD